MCFFMGFYYVLLEEYYTFKTDIIIFKTIFIYLFDIKKYQTKKIGKPTVSITC